VADWKGREAIRANLKAFIDTGFTALHRVTEYWDGGFLKVFRGVVDMTPDEVEADGASHDDPFLLYGREGQQQGASLDRRSGTGFFRLVFSRWSAASAAIVPWIKTCNPDPRHYSTPKRADQGCISIKSNEVSVGNESDR
jgi:hypothetical protein